MFLRNVSKAVLRPWAQQQKRIWLMDGGGQQRNSSSNSTTTAALLDKWKKRFETEEVTEVESSLRNILAHVLNVKLAVIKVCVLEFKDLSDFDIVIFTYMLSVGQSGRTVAGTDRSAKATIRGAMRMPNGSNANSVHRR